MEFLLKKQYLMNCFDKALEEESLFVGIAVQRKNHKKPTLIVIHAVDIERSREQFNLVYDDDLINRRVKTQRVVGFSHADSLAELQGYLLK